MAQTAVRLHLRRAFSLSTALLHHSAAAAAVNSLHPHTPLKSSAAISAVPRRNFHSSLSLAFAAAPRSFDDIDKIDPNAILFEGCDYNHWLIVMDFGKDPTQRPPPQQMVETYVQTAAQIFGSVEEAKRKIYACSTSTYTGFQVLVDEETSKKFEGLPGVIFVLPDSYIDPVNKEYGGDKYINGEIIHRPAPTAYGRSNRNYRSNDRRPSPPNQQGNPAYIQSGTMPQGGRDYTPSSPQQGSNDRRPSQPNQQGNPAYNQSGPMPQGGSGYTPSAPQQGIPQQQNLPPQQNYPPQPPSYAPPPQNYGPPGQAHGVPQYSGGGVGGYQGGQRNFVPPQQGNFNSPQGPVSNSPGNHGGPPPPGQYRANIPPPVAGAPGQAAGGSFPQGGPGAGYPPPLGGNQRFPQGSYEQNNPMGTPYNQAPPSGNTYGHGAGYPPPPPPGQNQRFPPTSNEQGNPMESGNYPPGAQTGFNQRRY